MRPVGLIALMLFHLLNMINKRALAPVKSEVI